MHLQGAIAVAVPNAWKQQEEKGMGAEKQ